MNRLDNKKIKKILFVVDTMRRGGAEVREFLFARQLKRMGYEVHWASTGGVLHNELNQEGIFTHVIEKDLFLNFHRAESITELIRFFKDIISSHNIHFASIHPFRFCVPAGIACIEEGIPYFITLHGPFPYFFDWMDKAGSIYLFKIFSEVILPGASKIFAVSEEAKNFVLHNFSISRDKIEIMPNPINEKLFRNDTPWLSRSKVCFISRLDPDKEPQIKNVFSFFHELKYQYPKSELLIVGGSFSEEYSKRLKEELFEKYHELSPSIHFIGERADVHNLIKSSWLVVGMDRVILETLACGRPAVLINHEGIKGIVKASMLDELAKTNFSGRGMPDVEAEKVIHDLKEIDEKELNHLSETALEEFSSKRLAQRLIQLLNQNSKISRAQFTTSSITLCLQSMAQMEDRFEKEKKEMEDRFEKEKKEMEDRFEKEKKEMEDRFEKEKKEMEDRYNREIEALKGENEELNSKIQQYEDRINGLTYQLQSITNSIGWSFLIKAYNVMYKLLPPHTRRYRFVKNIVMKIIKRDHSKKHLKNDLKNLKRILKEEKKVRGIIVYPPTIDWNYPLFQRPQHLALEFARKNYLFFYCTLNAQYDKVKGFEKIGDHLYLTYCSMDIWKYLDRPIVLISWTVNEKYLKYFKDPIIIYEIIDDLDHFHTYTPELLNAHKRLLKKATVVAASASRLFEIIQKERPDAILVENGVNFNHFYRAFSGEINTAEEMQKLREKYNAVIGYYGALAEWVDYELIAETAEEYPHIAYVLIGTDYDGSLRRSKITEIQNVYHLGPKPYKVLPSYLSGFDVATIPFRINNITLSTSPIKMFEYLAAGKPCLTTALPECKKYSPPVLVADNHEEFIQKVQEAVKLSKDEKYVKMAVDLAKQHTWERRVSKIIEALKEKEK